MTEFGYSAREVSLAIEDILGGDSRYSEERIRKYAKSHNLTIDGRGKKGQKFFLIPEGKLEDLVQGMKISISVRDLYNALPARYED